MEYRFGIDTKNTCWDRSYVYIEADSLEEATEEMKLRIEHRTHFDDITSSDDDMVFDTMVMMNVEDNNGESTVEISDENGNIIYQNGKEN